MAHRLQLAILLVVVGCSEDSPLMPDAGGEPGPGQTDGGSDGGTVIDPGDTFRGIPALPAFATYEGTPDETLSGTVASITGTGTETDPYLVTCDGPITGSDDLIQISGSYLIVDGCAITGSAIRLSGDHVSFRNGEVKRSSKTGVGISGTDIVLQNSLIEGHGLGGSAERHGVTANGGADRVWIIGNKLVGNSGDGLQFCHGCTTNFPKNVFIGGNEAYLNRENGFDFKYADRVVLSTNIARDHARATANSEWCYDGICGTYDSGSDGSGIIIGSDGAPTHVAVIDNQVFDNAGGIRIEASTDPFLIGNSLQNTGNGVRLEKEGGNVGIINNTFTGHQVGILQDWRENFCLDIRGNTFDGNQTDIDIQSNTVLACSTIEPNGSPVDESEYAALFESWFGFSW